MRDEDRIAVYEAIITGLCMKLEEAGRLTEHRIEWTTPVPGTEDSLRHTAQVNYGNSCFDLAYTIKPRAVYVPHTGMKVKSEKPPENGY